MPSTNFQPLTHDLSKILEWSLSQESPNAPRLRVAGKHFYLKPLSQKTTDKTCFIVKIFNYIIRLFKEGFQCCSPLTTAEKIIELTPKSIEDEFNKRLVKLKEAFETQANKFNQADPSETLTHLNEFQTLIAHHNEQLEQLSSCARMITSSLINKRLSNEKNEISLNFQRQESLFNGMETVLLKIQRTYQDIKLSIDQPMKTLITAATSKKVDLKKEQIENIICSAAAKIEEYPSKDIEFTNCNQLMLDQQFEEIRFEGFSKECTAVAQLIDNEIYSVLSKFTASIQNTDRKISELAEQTSENSLIPLSVSLELSSLLETISAQLLHLKHLPYFTKSIFSLVNQRFTSDEPSYSFAQELAFQTDAALSRTIAQINDWLSTFLVKPLENYLDGVANGKSAININLLHTFFEMAKHVIVDLKEGLITEETLASLNRNGFIFNHVFMAAASNAPNFKKFEAVQQLLDSEFLRAANFGYMWTTEDEANQVAHQFYNIAAQLAITLNAYITATNASSD